MAPAHSEVFAGRHGRLADLIHDFVLRAHDYLDAINALHSDSM
jgi:hypothetical protein